MRCAEPRVEPQELAVELESEIIIRLHRAWTRKELPLRVANRATNRLLALTKQQSWQIPVSRPFPLNMNEIRTPILPDACPKSRQFQVDWTCSFAVRSAYRPEPVILDQWRNRTDLRVQNKWHKFIRAVSRAQFFQAISYPQWFRADIKFQIRWWHW